MRTGRHDDYDETDQPEVKYSDNSRCSAVRDYAVLRHRDHNTPRLSCTDAARGYPLNIGQSSDGGELVEFGARRIVFYGLIKRQRSRAHSG